MTNRFLTRWMSNRAYYRLQVMGSDADNPDQRISEDAGFFAKATLVAASEAVNEGKMRMNDPSRRR